MADTKEVQAQLDLQLQINKVLQDRQAVLKAQEKALSDQVQLAVDMCKALKCEGLDDIEARLKTTREAMAKAAEEAGRLKGGMEDVKGAGAGAAGSMSKLNKSITTGKAAAAGFGLGILQFGGIFVQTFKNVLSMAGGLISALGKLGFAIVTLPFKIMEGFFNLAQQGGGGGPSPIAQTLEEIRREMGGLNNIAGKAAAGALPAFRAQMANVAGTGISMRKMFGPGREGIAAGMKYNLELMKAFGLDASAMSKYMTKETIPALAAYRKGLGLSAEQMAKFMKRSVTMGKSPTKALDEFANYSIQMGKVVGMSGNEFGKLMAEATDDIENFGTMSQRSIAEATAYTARLGIKLKELLGVIQKFDNFEDAAQSVSKLNQMFGMQLDTLEMMNEQDPSKRLRKMQDAYRATGKDIAALSRVEKKLLADSAGLTVEQAERAFSLQGMSASYDDITKAGAKAEKKQLSQAEAMSKLADSIERVFGGGGGQQFKGFFDAFTQGFSRGIMKSREFMEVSRAIRKSLREVYRGGIEIGKMFMRLFPGIKEMMGGLRDLFNPTRFKVLMKDLKGIFETFFKDLRTDPKAGAEKFIESLKKRFKDFFGASGNLGMTVVEGGKTFLKALWGIAQAVGPMLLEGFVKGINAIADFLENPPEIPGAVSAMGEQLWAGLVRVFDALVDRLGPPLMRALNALWERIGPWVTKTLQRVFMISIFKAFALGTIRALGAAAIVLIKDRLLKIFTAVPTPPAPAPSGGAPNPAQAARMIPGLLTFMGALVLLLAAFAAVVVIYRAADLKPQDALAIGAVVVSLAGAAALMSVALKAVPDDIWEDAKKLTAVLVMMGLAGVVAAGVSALLASFEPPSIGQVTAFTAVMMTLVTASLPLILGAYVIGQMKGQVDKALIGMGILAVFMIQIGVVGTVISGILSLIPNPAGVAALMEAITSIMYATMLMLPVALALGLMAASSPFGLIGLAAIAVGFEVLVGITSLMVVSLIPAIKELSKIKIADPRSFKAVTGALVSIIRASSGFMMALAGLAFVLRPAGGQTNPDVFEKNIKSFKKIVTVILKSGVQEIINNLTNFAKTAEVKSGTAQVISSIAAMLGSVAKLMSAFSPSSDAWNAVVESSNIWVSGHAAHGRILAAIKNFQETGVQSLVKVLPAVSKSMSELVESIKNLPPAVKDVAPFIQSLASIFSAVATVMTAMSPSSEAWNAVTEATGLGARMAGQGRGPVLREMALQIDQIANNAIVVFDKIGEAMSKMVNDMSPAIQDILRSAGNLDSEQLKAVSSILSSILGVVGAVMGVVMPAVKEASALAKSTGKYLTRGTFSGAMISISAFMLNIGSSIDALREPMASFVSSIISVARGVTNVRGLKSKIEVLSAAFGVVSSMVSTMTEINKMGHMRGDEHVSGAKFMMLTLRRFTRPGADAYELFRPRDGVMQKFINLMDGLKVSPGSGLKSKAETISAMMSAVQTMSTALKQMSDSGSIDSLDSLANKLYDQLNQGNVQKAISSMSSVLEAAPRTVKGTSDRVSAITRAYNDLSQALSNPLDDRSIRAVVDIGNALSGQRSLTVKHENVNINVAIDVKMDASSIGKGILEVNNRGGTNPFNISGNRRFATQP